MCIHKIHPMGLLLDLWLCVILLSKVAQKIEDKIVELESVVIGSEVQLPN